MESTYQFPPESLEELRLIIMDIQAGHLDLPLGNQSLKAITSMLDNPRLVSLHTISELAETYGVSPATITRLSRMLGFNGFKAFQKLFKSNLSANSAFYSGHAQRQAGQQGVTLGIDVAKENLDALGEFIEPEQLTQVAKVLLKARNVHCFGYRQSFGLAHFLAYGLGLLRQQVHLLNTSWQGLAYALGQLGPRDVLVGISFAPYSTSTVRMLQSVHRLEVPMVIITDSHSSPIARLGDHFLRVPAESDFFSNSFVASSMLMELILSRVAQLMGNRGVEQLQQHEMLIDMLNDEY